MAINLELIGGSAFAVRVTGQGVAEQGPWRFRYLGLNACHAAATGIASEVIAGRSPEECLPADLAARVSANYAECARRRAPFEYVETIDLPVGRKVWRTRLTPLFDRRGTLRTLLGTALDITREVEAEQALRAANERLALALEAIDGATWYLDLATGRFEPSPRVALLMGEPAPRLLTVAEWAAYVVPEDRGAASLDPMVEGTGDCPLANFRIRTPAGHVRWLRCRRRLVRDAGGQPVGICGITVDVTDEKLRELQLAEDAFRDGLTGLFNRRALTRALDRSVDQASAQTAARTAAPDRPADEAGPTLFMLDLDGFKGVNDTLGHAAGDAVLVEVAARLARVTRSADMAARLGGDEFVVLVPGCRPDEADALAGRIAEAVAQPFAWGGRPVAIRTSVGHAAWEPGLSAAGLMAAADTRLYDAKRRAHRGLGLVPKAA